MGSPIIIPVAGGKGGIGKSLIAANIAVTLAGRGYDVVAIDLDLGASNLHAFLGVRSSSRNILNFVQQNVELEDMAIETSYKGARIICGASNVAGAANIPEEQKNRILQNIDKLSCDYVILDLGGGSSFNVTDFFLTGKLGIIVLVPEITSLLDAYSFLKTMLYRRLQQEWPTDTHVGRLIEEFKDPGNARKMITVEHLNKEVEKHSPQEGQKMRLLMQGLGVKVVINKVREQKDFKVVKTIAQLAAKNLNIAVHNAGYIPYDTAVSKSVNTMIPFVTSTPLSPATAQMTQLCRVIVNSGI